MKDYKEMVRLVNEFQSYKNQLGVGLSKDGIQTLNEFIGWIIRYEKPKKKAFVFHATPKRRA
jgi:hypothetical protein